MKKILTNLKKKEAEEYFKRNKKYYDQISFNDEIINLIKNNNIKANKILEIGCANGYKLNQYAKLLKSKKSYGIDISKKAIFDGRKKHKNLKLLNISSLEMDKIKINFDLIICGFFLYKLDRELIFKQFDLICEKLINNGFLVILDFDPLFRHTNKDFNTKNSLSYKMNYDNFLVESGLFEVIYKFKYKVSTNDKKKFKSDKVSLTLLKKVNFQESYPENI